MNPELRQATVIRDFVPAFVVAGLRTAIERCYERADRDPNPNDSLNWGGLGLGAVRPELGRTLKPIERAIAARWSGTIIDRYSAFRRIERRTYIRWHADADGAGSWPDDPIWNCWLPLSAVGRGGSPSLEVIVNSEARMRTLGPNSGPSEVNRAHRPDDWVAEYFPDAKVLCPIMNPGDALVFNHWLLHRTEPVDWLAGRRIGAELRFAVTPKVPKVWWRRMLGKVA